MKNLSTVFTLLWPFGLLCYCLYSWGLRITFKPFTISFTDWPLAVAWLMVVVGLGIGIIHIRKKAYLKGSEDAYAYAIIKIKESNQAIHDEYEKHLYRFAEEIRKQQNPPKNSDYVNEEFNKLNHDIDNDYKGGR